MAYRDSLPVVAQLDLVGVWVHDPADPAGTIRHYPYGSAAREQTVDVMGTALYYAGRTYPVVDHGPHAAESVSVSVQVPHGPDWRGAVDSLRELAHSRATILYRDNRGRSMPGVVSGYRESDQRWGTQVSLTVTRVHVPPAVTVVV